MNIKKGYFKNMKKAALLIGILMVPVLAIGASVISPESALALTLGDGLNATGGASGLAGDTDGNSVVTLIVNIMLWLIGILAVIMLIFGGIKYATSAGDTTKVTSAKNTIMYAVIGLVIAVFSWAIVSWVTNTLGVTT